MSQTEAEAGRDYQLAILKRLRALGGYLGIETVQRNVAWFEEKLREATAVAVKKESKTAPAPAAKTQDWRAAPVKPREESLF